MTGEYKQLDFVTESNITKRGGKRDNSGRKSTHGGQTKTIRVNVKLISVIEQLKTGQFDFVTQSKQEDIEALKAELDQCKADNIKLVKERDTALQKLKVNLYSNGIQIIDNERLKTRFDVLERKFYAGTNKVCQCVTSIGTQCTRSADKLIQTNDVMIWTCKQHRAKYPNVKQVV